MTSSQRKADDVIDLTIWEGFGSFAVLDLETSNLPADNFNKVGITELSIYGFAAKELEKGYAATEIKADSAPLAPRILHKLHLMLNPRMRIHPGSEAVTGLDNYMLESESYFDKNAGETIKGFLAHLQQPVCLVAHNGWNFDFPILKQAYDKLQMVLPGELLCLDSLRAFVDIDEARKRAEKENTTIVSPVESAAMAEVKVLETETLNALDVNELIDWRTKNETTPKRPPTPAGVVGRKRKVLDCASTDERSSPTNGGPGPRQLRRTLFPTLVNPREKRWFPPKGLYKLGTLYERTFNQRPKQCHYAEADVDTLMKLIIHYGRDFLAYAEDHAIPFVELRKLGNNF